MAGYSQNLRAVAAFVFCLFAGMAGHIYTAATSLKLSQSSTTAEDAADLVAQVSDQALLEDTLDCCDWTGLPTESSVPRCDVRLPKCVDSLQGFMTQQYADIANVMWGLLAFYLFALICASVYFVLLVRRNKRALRQEMAHTKSLH